jgi:alkanesulfonate monooxygenase SsuD/methylene tetrahydromethanopterin reductase-like flavin-dependent oxidoreductase (luciferase family)
MRIGIGLPAAVPGAPAPELAAWAEAAERHGFPSTGVIDRLVYDNLDPLIALAAAAARTERIELLTTVLNVPWRRNAVVLAKQLASVDAVSGGRLTAGLALGGWPEDHAAVGPSPQGQGAVMDDMLVTMHAVWRGELVGAGGPLPATPPGRPRLLFGGFAPAAFSRAARFGHGWVAPSFGLDALTSGIASVRAAWRDAGRSDRPRVVVERYVCLGSGAAATAEHYLDHYYGAAYLPAVLADTATTVEQLHAELDRLRDAGADDVVLLPCSADLDQVPRVADALATAGVAV